MRKKLLYTKNQKYCGSQRVTHALTFGGNQIQPVIRREFPGKGYHHFVTRKDINAFIGLLPEWPIISRGLSEVLLARGERGCDGWYTGRVLGISAWESDLWREVPPDYYLEHKALFSRLGVQCKKQGFFYLCRFTILTVKAFQLLHVFLHELGHHYDRITTKKMREASRGEMFAEQYANRYQEIVWRRYVDLFGL